MADIPSAAIRRKRPCWLSLYTGPRNRRHNLLKKWNENSLLWLLLTDSIPLPLLQTFSRICDPLMESISRGGARGGQGTGEWDLILWESVWNRTDVGLTVQGAGTEVGIGV